MQITKDKHSIKGRLCRFYTNIKSYFSSQAFKDNLRAPIRIGACLFLFALGVFLGLKVNLGPVPVPSAYHLEEPEPTNMGTFTPLEPEDDNPEIELTPELPQGPMPTVAEGLEMIDSGHLEAEMVFTPDGIIMPASGQIIKQPGWFYSEVMGDWRYFSGVDIATTPGVQVKAAGAGVIKRIYLDESYGTVIVVGHGDRYETRYGNVYCPELVLGQKVCKGETLGSTEKDVLHFELFDNSEAVDPAGLFDEGN